MTTRRTVTAARFVDHMKGIGRSMRQLTRSVVLVGCLLAPISLRGQATTDSVRVSRLVEQTGRSVRVSILGRRIEAFVNGITPDSIVLRDEVSETRLPLTAIDTLWVREGQARLGAVYGATSLALPVGALVMLAGAAFCESDCGRTVPLAVGLYGGGAAVVGALAGAIIASPIRVWRRLVP